MREMKRVVQVIGGKETIRMEGRWCEREITSAREMGRRLEKEDFVHCRRKREGTSANIGGVSWKSEREGIIVSETGWWFQSPPDPRRARFSNGCSSHPRRENRRLTRSFKEWATPCAYRLFFVSRISIPAGQNSDITRELTKLVPCFVRRSFSCCAKICKEKSGATIRHYGLLYFFKILFRRNTTVFNLYTYSSIQRRFILLVINVSSDVVCNVKFD